jgi:hypothetical protein
VRIRKRKSLFVEGVSESFQRECHTRGRIKRDVFSVFYSLCERMYLGIHGTWA